MLFILYSCISCFVLLVICTYMCNYVRMWVGLYIVKIIPHTHTTLSTVSYFLPYACSDVMDRTWYICCLSLSSDDTIVYIIVGAVGGFVIIVVILLVTLTVCYLCNKRMKAHKHRKDICMTMYTYSQHNHIHCHTKCVHACTSGGD